MRNPEDRSGPLVTCTGNPYQSAGTSSPVSTGDLPVLPVQVTNGPDRSSGFLIDPDEKIKYMNLVLGKKNFASSMFFCLFFSTCGRCSGNISPRLMLKEIIQRDISFMLLRLFSNRSR